MANKVGWGQGSVNNNIGWGQGAVNNSVNWGNIQAISPSGETNIVGGGGTPVEQLLLDEYPNAAAAYSLRDLSTASVGSAVVRVRRSSDNTEQDFTSTDITDGTLTTFTGANDGFVTTWYDQSGNNNNDATQTTASSQPQILDNGSLITKNGKPVVKNVSSELNLFYEYTSANQASFTAFSIDSDIQPDSSNGVRLYSSSSQLNPLTSNVLNIGSVTSTLTNETIAAVGGLATLVYGAGLCNNINYPLGSHLISVQITSSGTSINNDGNVLSLTPSASRGDFNGVNYPYRLEILSSTLKTTPMYAFEYVFYNLDQSANRTGIETNINSHYNIY